MSDVADNNDINSDSLFRVTPRELAVKLEKTFYAGNVPMVKGSPAIGKSSIFKQVAKKLNIKLIDHRLSTSAPEDLSGLPEFYTDSDGNRRARFAPFDIFPIEGQTVPKGFDGWMLFLDEMNSAPKNVQAAAYKLILDRMVGQDHLHQQVVVGAAGNLSTDRAITNPMSTAMQSRLCHFHLVHNFEDWLEDVALKHSWDSRIIAYLSRHPTRLYDFRPDHNEDTFCSPRTWEFMNNYLRNMPAGVIPKDETSTFAGTITSGIAVDFVSFTSVYKELVNYKDVIADPMTCKIPDDINQQWANMIHLLDMLDEDNYETISKYANRFALNFRILFFRNSMVRLPELHGHPAFAKAMIELNRYLKPSTSPYVKATS